MPGEIVLRPSGDIDIAVAEGLRAAWYALLDEAQPERVIVDLKAVSFLDSQGLSLLAGLAKRQRARGGTVAVRNASPLIEGLMRVTRLTQAVVILPEAWEDDPLP